MELLRDRCAGCGRTGVVVCARCAASLSAPPAMPVQGIGPVASLFAYEGAGADLIRALKFGDDRRLVHYLADPLADLVDLSDLIERSGSGAVGFIVSWIPTSAGRRRERGFDQAELLARAVARRLGVHCRSVLRRRPGPTQTGRTRVQRADNVAFVRAGRCSGPVVMIDDVCTTGATIRAAADALTTGGVRPASAATFLVAARTP